MATLRDAFRDVEYGARSPADRLPQVEAAIETIERATVEMADDSPAETAGPNGAKSTDGGEANSFESEDGSFEKDIRLSENEGVLSEKDIGSSEKQLGVQNDDDGSSGAGGDA